MSYVMVPVPEERVTEIFGILSRSADPVASATENGAADWAREPIVRMYRESPPAMKAFLDHLADNPERDFTSVEMAQAIGRTDRQFRGVLGAFGHRVHSRYRWDTWPFDVRWDTGRGFNVYRMSRAVADMIRSGAQRRLG
jgi:hypothetical protein